MITAKGSDLPVPGLSGVLVVLLVDYLPQHRAWGWLRLAQGATALKGTTGLLFAKIMGSGSDGGFGLRPSSSHQGLIGLFTDQLCADEFIASLRVADMVKRAREYWIGTLAITSARGQWDQQNWAQTPLHCLKNSQISSTDTLDSRPIATLTRASIRPAKAMSFWRYAPAAQEELGLANGCYLAMGLGEAPIVRQCTFSLWKNTESMMAYAHGNAHGQAIAAAKRHDFFAESMFVRLRVLNMWGTWQGKHFSPLMEATSA